MMRINKAVILGIVLLAIACVGFVSAGAADNIVVNGGFEEPVVLKNFETMSGNAITGWTIDKGTADLIHTHWQPHSGSQSVDLSGINPGKMSQSLTTIPGATYEITFWMCSNPDGNKYGKPIKELQVSWDGTVLSPTYTHDSTTTTRENMGWTMVTISNLKATSATTVLSFETIFPDGAYGIALDDISVIDQSPIPAPEFPGFAVPAGVIVGMIGVVLVLKNRKNIP